MKTFLLCILTTGFITITISAQQQDVKKINSTSAILKLNSSFDTLQYSLGAFIGQWLINNGFTVNNHELFNRGMEDILLNKPRAINDSAIVPIIAAYQLSTRNERNRQMEEQLFSNLKGKPGVGVLPNGVHYIVIKAGTGIRPMAHDTIEINAIGVFPDGTVFENTYQTKQVITTVPGSMIPGLNEAVQLMPEGSTWRIFIPSALAYGVAGLENMIPGNMALVYDINLEKVKR